LSPTSSEYTPSTPPRIIADGYQKGIFEQYGQAVEGFEKMELQVLQQVAETAARSGPQMFDRAVARYPKQPCMRRPGRRHCRQRYQKGVFEQYGQAIEGFEKMELQVLQQVAEKGDGECLSLRNEALK
jgi:hypothetical protein